jgi:hypothetical protein
MSRNNHRELDKIKLVGWVDQALKTIINKKNMKFKFRATCIWPFNPIAMDIKTQPSQIYITELVNDQGNENKIRNDEV